MLQMRRAARDLRPDEPGDRPPRWFVRVPVPSGEERQRWFKYLKSLCPVFLDEEYLGNGKWKKRKKEWEELDVAESVEFCAWVQRLASIEFNQVIQDPQ